MASAFEMLNRRTIRTEPNPYDKTTVVSIYPFEIVEVLVTIQPSRYVIPAGTLEKPSITVIGSASWWKESGENEPLMEVPVFSNVVAKNLVDDYIHSMNAAAAGVRHAGVFVLPGPVTLEQVLKDYQPQLKRADAMQKAWYEELIKQADAMWSRTNGNPLAVGDDARFAAKSLSKDKPWIKDFQQIQNIACVACGNMRNPQYPVCPHCKNIIDTELAKKLNIKPA